MSSLLLSTHFPLILSAFLGSGLAYRAGLVTKHFPLLLVFSGSYLFAMTITDILPSLFIRSQADSSAVGLYVLVGFFLQLFLEFFSGGIAHGHLKSQFHQKAPNSNAWTMSVPFLALCLHALLDGVVLATPSVRDQNSGLLFGITLHKVPVAFVLTVLLMRCKQSRWTTLAYVCCFALSSPLGCWLGDSLASLQHIWVAIASGSLLHVATTILFESNPDHRVNGCRLLVSLLGATLGVFAVHWV